MKNLQFLIVLAITPGVYLNMPRYTVTYANVRLETEHDATGSSLTESLSECAILCEDQSSGCTIASYNDLNGECTLYHWLNVHRVYINKDPTTVHDTRAIINIRDNFLRFSVIGNGYDIEVTEGDALCERFGGVVGSLTDMDDAFALGWSSCLCGWLSNGSPYYWVHEDDLRTDCSRGSRVDCSGFGPTKFDVYCSFK